jgi:hypothetical protein
VPNGVGELRPPRRFEVRQQVELAGVVRAVTARHLSEHYTAKGSGGTILYTLHGGEQITVDTRTHLRARPRPPEPGSRRPASQRERPSMDEVLARIELHKGGSVGFAQAAEDLSEERSRR